MEEILNRYKIKSFDQAYNEAMLSLRTTNPYLKTGISKLDSVIKGVEVNKLVTIGGISGSGKSALANIIETNIASNYENVEVLNFSFEMSAKDQVLRKISAQESIPTNTLRSNMKTMTVKDELKPYKINHQSISYIEESKTVAQIVEIIEYFQKKCIESNKWLVVFIDHALLVDGKSSEERSIIGDLQKALIRLKKIGKCTIFQLMQLNRNIESSERRVNRNMHYPIRGDLSTADAVYQASDYVWVIHRPELLGITSYGPQEIPSVGRVFLHIIKSREGDPCNLLFENNLKINKIE